MKTKMIRRVAVVVLAIALLTTTVLCGTMAKYTSSFDEKTATVTIAKYDVKLNGKTSTEYASQTITVTPASFETTGAQTVADNVLAPGMYAEIAALTITNNSDVAVTFKMVNSQGQAEDITASDAMPTNAKLVISETSLSADQLQEKASSTASNTITTFNGDLTYVGGTGATTKSIYVYVVWAFETASGDGADTQDGQDAAKATDAVSTFTVTIPKIVVEQVEPVAAAPATT